MEKRIGYVCCYCGSNSILMDAWAEWDTESQEWILSDTLVQAYCQQCDGETSLIDVELAPAD